MKKLFSTILVLGLLLSGNAYAEKIILKCKHTNGSFVTIKLDTDTKKAKFKGSTIDRYILDKDEFKFLFNIEEYDYRASLDKDSGVLTVETFWISKEEKTKMIANVKSSIISEKKDGDLDYLVKTIYSEYDNKDRAFDVITAECEKVKKKL